MVGGRAERMGGVGCDATRGEVAGNNSRALACLVAHLRTGGCLVATSQINPVPIRTLAGTRLVRANPLRAGLIKVVILNKAGRVIPYIAAACNVSLKELTFEFIRVL